MPWKKQQQTLKPAQQRLARANVICVCQASSKCVLGLHAASLVFEVLESSKKSRQGSSVQVDGMMDSVRLVKSELSDFCTTERLAKIFKNAHTILDLTVSTFPREGFETISTLEK